MPPNDVQLEAVPFSPGPESSSKPTTWFRKLRVTTSKTKQCKGAAHKATQTNTASCQESTAKLANVPFTTGALGAKATDLSANIVVPKSKSLPSIYSNREWTVDMPIPYNQVDAEDVSFHHVMAVIQSWDKVTKQCDWQKTAGVAILRKMFELDATFRVQYGFGDDCDWNDQTVYQSPRFVAKGHTLVMMFDKAIHSLGPDLEPLEAELQTLGKRHVFLNALPEHWVSVGTALFHALEQLLGDDFTAADQKSWSKVYSFLAYNMIIGLIKELSERCGN